MELILSRVTWMVSLLMGWMGIMMLVQATSGIFGHESSLYSVVVYGSVLGILLKQILLPDTLIRRSLRRLGENTISPQQTTQAQPSAVGATLGEEKAAKAAELVPEVMTEAEAITQPVEVPAVSNSVAPREPSFLVRFFAENALAKIGGILLFLGVVFFLSIGYAMLGSVGRTLMGFMAGFGFYAIGAQLGRRGYTTEGHVLRGVGIITNYATILAARYLLAPSTNSSDASTEFFLSEGLTFFFLVLNTLFALATGMVLGSRTFLVFSVLMAYIVPFLVGWHADGPYVLLGYAIAVSIGAYALAWFYFYKQESRLAQEIASLGLIGGTLVTVVASFTIRNETDWIFSVVAGVCVVSGAVITALKRRAIFMEMASIYMVAYILLAILFGFGSGGSVMPTPSGELYVGPILENTFSYLLSLMCLSAIGFWVVLFARNTQNLAKTGMTILLALLAVPLLLGFCFFLFPGNLSHFFGISVGFILFGCFAALWLLGSVLSVGFQLIGFGLLGGFLLLANSVVFIRDTIDLFGVPQETVFGITQFVIIWGLSLAFYLGTLLVAHLRREANLGMLGTLATVCMLAPVVRTTGTAGIISAIGIAVFGVVHLGAPLLSGSVRASVAPFLASAGAGLLFLSGTLYVYGSHLFPGVALGLAYMGLALVYLVQAGFLWGMSKPSASLDTSTSMPAVSDNLLIVLASSLVAFSSAVGFALSDYAGMVEAVWMFETAVVFWVASRLRHAQVAMAGCILMGVAFLKLSAATPSIHQGDYAVLGAMALVGIALMLALQSVRSFESKSAFAHDILHVLWMGLLGTVIVQVVPASGHGWSLLGVSAFFSVLIPLYARWGGTTITRVWVVAFLAWLAVHVGWRANDIFDQVAYDAAQGTLTASAWMYDSLQYVSSILLVGAGIVGWHTTQTPWKNATAIGTGLYAFGITSVYVSHLFASPIFLTLYWTLVAAVCLAIGIRGNIQWVRTVGLYIGTLMLGKLLLYDIWIELDGALVRVIALMVAGGLMIAFSRRFEGRLGEEFAIAHIWSKPKAWTENTSANM